jgi:hypothetical protein
MHRRFAHGTAPAQYARQFTAEEVLRWQKGLDSADLAARDEFVRVAHPGDTWTARRCYTVGYAAGTPVLSLVRVA